MIRHLTCVIALATAVPICAKSPQLGAAAIPIATDAPLAPASVERSMIVAGKHIAYRAQWFETVLRDRMGKAMATISATSYVRTSMPASARRPVLVLFNGGPGASSSPLHFGALGPRRLGERNAAGNRALMDNPETVLDVADLLFVDPVGTGFSRPLTPEGGKPYWTVAGDAASVLRLIRDWLMANGRMGAPLFVAGESYGAYRLGTMARDMADLNVAGLILISPGLDFGTAADQEAIERLPTMAVAAWQHRKAASDMRDAAQVWEDARRFAQSEYAVALQQGAALDAASRAAIAQRVAALIGLSLEQIVAADLRVDSQRFLEMLVPGSIVGRLDVRVAQPLPPKPVNTDRPAAANDPSLGLGRTNVIMSKPIGDYLKHDLGVTTDREYFSLTLDVNFNWDWRRDTPAPGASWNVTAPIAALMKAQPGARLLLMNGYYDLATPMLGARYALMHSAVPLDRTTMIALPAGHSPFDGNANRVAAASAIRTFLVGVK